MSATGRVTFHPMRVLLALGDGSIEGDEARVAAALLIQTVPGLDDLTVEEVIDTAKRISSCPSLLASLDQLLAVMDEHGTGQVSLEVEE